MIKQRKSNLKKTIGIRESSKSNNYEKHFLKRNVLTKLLKLVKELAKRIYCWVSRFHSLGAATCKALSPVFDFDGGATSRF